jgi:NADH-quinone oxidoreductase subunit I
MATIKVNRPEKLTFWESIYIPAILSGLRLSMKRILGKRVTLQYPDEEHEFAPNYRGVHRLNKDDDGRIKCVACEMCAASCPAHCITIQAKEVDWPDRDKIPSLFEIDELKCIFCGYCVEACPEDAIHMTQEYHMIARKREDMIFGMDKLLAIYDETKDKPALRGVDFGRAKGRQDGPPADDLDVVQRMAYPVVGVVTKEDRK